MNVFTPRPPSGRSATRVRGMRLALAASLLAGLPVASPLAAQGVPRHATGEWRTARVLKWSLLAVSAGLGLWAYTETRRADDAYDGLRRLCTTDPARCTLDGGAYADAGAEALFSRANAGDRRARVGLLAGQAALLGSAAFFIVDLDHRGPPENIPYDPPASPPPSGARLRVGLRVPLR